MNNQPQYFNRFIKLFTSVEKTLAAVLAVIILIIVLAALYRVIFSTIDLVEQNLTSPNSIDFNLYSDVFAKILTLLISIEFMNAIVDIIKFREIKKLLIDVIIITGLALCRKLIVTEFKEYEPLYIFGFGFVLIALGVLYFFITNKNAEKI